MVRAICGAIKAMRRAALVAALPALLAAGWGTGAAAATELESLGPRLDDAGSARVETVIDADTVVLSDGREVRFVGLQAPKLPLGRAGFEEWPLAAEARQAVDAMIGGEVVHVRPGTTARDRHGRVLAHLFRARDGLWVQGALLRRGWARVYTFPDNRLLAEDMLAAEAEARGAARGIWALPWYGLRDAATLPAERDAQDTFQIVRGTVRDVATVRGTTYLNFGADWREDFTAALDRDAARGLEEAGLPPESLMGREVLVRGWIRSRNGPMIEVTHPEQIQATPALVRAGKDDL